MYIPTVTNATKANDATTIPAMVPSDSVLAPENVEADAEVSEAVSVDVMLGVEVSPVLAAVIVVSTSLNGSAFLSTLIDISAPTAEVVKAFPAGMPNHRSVFVATKLRHNREVGCGKSRSVHTQSLPGQHHVCVRVAIGLVRVRVVVQAGKRPRGQAVPG